MRRWLVPLVLAITSNLAFPQNTPTAVLPSLGFLVGVWVADDEWGRPITTVEFHWNDFAGNPALVGRHWEGEANNCPACVTQGLMLAFEDPDSTQLRLRMADKRGLIIDFQLSSASSKSVQFLSIAGFNPDIYRLTYEQLPNRELVIALERSEFAGGPFSVASRWQFHPYSAIHLR